jgi:YidC/Oxa1 family membrane protein insertase
MNMDRNTVLGFVLLAVLLFVYLFISTRNSQQMEVDQKRKADSVANVTRIRDSINLAKADTVKQINPVNDTLPGFKNTGSESLLVAENDLLRITFTNKGGQPKSVELKNYKSLDGRPVILGGTASDKISYNINTGGRSATTADLFFTPGIITQNGDSAQTITFQATGSAGEQISHTFIVRTGSYLIDWNVQLLKADQLLTQGSFNLTWQAQPQQHESDVTYERQQTTVGYYEDDEFDYIQTKTERKFEKPVKWVSVAQQFFNTTLIAPATSFSSGEIKMAKATEDSSRKIADVTTNLQAKLPLSAQSSFPLQLYYGPNDYKILNKVPVEGMPALINLGRDMYSFVRPINKYIVMPVFDFFKSFIGSFGLVIALLTLFIRLATSPLVYSSYLSGAKMKALRPEIDKLKERLGNDQQQIGMEQMKLFREAGVNPLGGCIPALLQIPIFFALYSFFNSNIALRGESFLWAENLASYDDIIRFPFHIWGLGSHLSLFTITAAGTSFLISLYNANMTPDQSNPALKYMPYIFPFILLFIFNPLPSALTWYYTVSNVITLILQFIIQNYIIDHDKILAKLEANRKKPKTKSKWQERLEQMQEQQKKMQEMKNKSAKK